MKRIALLFIFLFVALMPLPAHAACNGVTVVRGDTLYRIATSNKTTVAELVKLNGIANPNLIHVGQVVCLTNERAIEAATPSAYTRPNVTVAGGLEGYTDLLNVIVDAAFSKCPSLIGELSEVRLDAANTTRPAIVGWYQEGAAHLFYISAKQVDYIVGVIAHEAAHARQFREGRPFDELDAMIIASTCGT